MKKLALMLAIVLALSMLIACGGDSSTTSVSDNSSSDSTNDTNTSSEQDADFIKSSQLIPLEDARRIVHESLEVSIDKKTNESKLDLPSKSLPGFTTTYSGDAFLVLVVTVNYNESYIKGIKRDLDTPDFIISEEVEGVGDWAAFIESMGKSLYVGYKDIFLNISIAGMKSVSIAEEEADEIFKELGRLACKNYDALK
ncbi:MAG: hypothetical protein FWG14_05605 [Peptococcaceae bacterium]|nr:hypothetical protein [Peptococcaceae bacterium]